VLADDHVFWPDGYLSSILAPFENLKVGSVGTVKRVRRQPLCPGLVDDFFNSWDVCTWRDTTSTSWPPTTWIAAYCVISGRTSAHRTQILNRDDFIQGFCYETIFFGMFGPLNADDDNFIARWVIRYGYEIVFQSGPNAIMETTLGEVAKFQSQCLRWVRTTWRSNLASLVTDRTVWKRQPWGVYAIHLASLTNFALFYDSAMLFTLWKTVKHTDFVLSAMLAMALVIFLSKLVKTMAHFQRHPRDLIFLLPYILFGYWHSLIKLYAGITFWKTSWGSRKNVN
jgi:hypothetical protein